MLEVVRFVCGPLQNNVYLWVHGGTRQCAVIDPGIEAQPLHDYIRQHGLKVQLILNTHGHFDHVYGNAEFKAQYAVPLAVNKDDWPLLARLPETAANWGFPDAPDSPEPDLPLEHGQKLTLGDQTIEVRHTPGHSPGQVALINGLNAIVGDTLFYRGVGRWDLPGADWYMLEQSIRAQLYTLPDETIVWPGHGDPTTIGDERRLNPYIGEGARFIPKLP